MLYFPLGLVISEAFCNRIEERTYLTTNIKMNRSTIVVSSRRYGKSSLVLCVLKDLAIPHRRVDLFVTLNESTIAREIINGVNGLINEVINKPEQLTALVKDILTNMSTKWSIGINGARVELIRRDHQEDALAIRDILVICDVILAKKISRRLSSLMSFKKSVWLPMPRALKVQLAVLQSVPSIWFLFSQAVGMCYQLCLMIVLGHCRCFVRK